MVEGLSADARNNVRHNAMTNKLAATFLKSVATAGLLFGLAGSAVALPITSGTSSFTLNWLFSASATQVLSASAAVTVTSWSDTQLGLQFDPVSNTTVLQPGTGNANILAIGLNFDPTVTGASFSSMGDVFGGLDNDVNFPGGFLATDVCIYAANNCQGGSVNEGLTPGATDAFELLLVRTATGQDAAWNLATAPIKFQTGLGSFEFNSCTLGQGCDTPSRVPEPDSLALVGALAIGFGSTALVRRRRRA